MYDHESPKIDCSNYKGIKMYDHDESILRTLIFHSPLGALFLVVLVVILFMIGIKAFTTRNDVPKENPATQEMRFALEEKSVIPQGEQTKNWELANNQKATLVAARHFIYWLETKKDNIEINSLTSMSFNDDGTTSTFIVVYKELKTSTLGRSKQ